MLNIISLGAKTLSEINGGDYPESLNEGGGVNCRHGWEMASNDLRGQFHRGDEAEELLNA